MAERDVAVIVPCHHAAESIGLCLDALERQTLEPERFEVHVVDDGLDRTETVVGERHARWGERLRFHRARADSGPGEKRNLGAEVADAPYLAFTDSDCVPEPGWLEHGLQRLRAGVDLVHGRTAPDGGRPGGTFAHFVAVEEESPLYESCNVMYDAASFRAAGGFPTDLFARTGEVFGEDAELAWRVRRSGGRAVFAAECEVRHLRRGSTYAHHLGEQWRARLFPLLVRRVPELRTELLVARLFLGTRSVRYDAAVAGATLARCFPPAAVLALPYLLRLRRAAHGRPQAAVLRVAKLLLSDTLRASALAWGSVRYRSPVL